MPSATISSSMVQAAGPEMGSVPSSHSMSAQFHSGAQSETIKQVLGVIEKKVRNLEKKKGKLDDYQAKVNGGECLNQDQLIQKAVKKAARREQLQREEAEQRRLRAVLELQFMLDKLGEETVRNELKQGLNGTPLLTDDDLTALDEFYKLVGPERDQNLSKALAIAVAIAVTCREEVVPLSCKCDLCALQIQKAVKKAARREQLQREEAEQRRLKAVLELQFMLDKLGEETVRNELKQGLNGTPLLTDDDLTALDEFYKLVGPERDQNLRLSEQYNQATLHYWDLLEAKDKAVAGTTYKALKETLDKVLQSGYFDSTHTHQNGVCEEEEEQQLAVAEAPEAEEQPAEPESEVTEEYTEPSEVEPTEDSMLEYESQAMDPAIVSAQPMKTAQSMDMPQMVCPPVHAESRLAQPNTVPVQPEVTQVPMVSPVPEAFATSQPLYQTSHTTDPHPQTEAIDPIQASMSLASEQPPTSSALPAVSQPQVFQAVSSKPLHSSGINVNAAPFQSMQTVFNMNAPVPPAIEAEALKQPSQYPNSYSQGFNSQTPHQVEQPELQQEQLQSVVGSFHTQDQTIPATGGHQQLSQQPQQGSGFTRPSQSFYNSRAMSRGGPRNSRGMLNGYRGPSNGFRGGYDNYRPPFSNTPNSGYGQSQFNAPRDYSNSSYQRDGYQQNYKRGTGQGPRGCSRGNAQVMRS
ncbi:UNVERIFIED_CONTAM: hypothetical protein FKN15_017149 [Acipenser sinensis]